MANEIATWDADSIQDAWEDPRGYTTDQFWELAARAYALGLDEAAQSFEIQAQGD